MECNHVDILDATCVEQEGAFWRCGHCNQLSLAASFTATDETGMLYRCPNTECRKLVYSLPNPAPQLEDFVEVKRSHFTTEGLLQCGHCANIVQANAYQPYPGDSNILICPNCNGHCVSL